MADVAYTMLLERAEKTDAETRAAIWAGEYQDPGDRSDALAQVAERGAVAQLVGQLDWLPEDDTPEETAQEMAAVKAHAQRLRLLQGGGEQ